MNKTILPAAGLGLLAILANGAIAQAHATLEQAEAKNDTTYKAVLRVPHGCDGKATNEVRIKLPEGFISAQPMPKAGWNVEVIKGDYAKTYKNHGEDVKSGAVEIRWKGGDLPDEFYDEFVVRGKLTGFAADTTIYFPSMQLCGSDASVKWDEIPAHGQDPHALKNPAPQLKVLAGASGNHAAHGSSHNGHDAAKAIKAGDLQLEGFYTKAMLPGAKVAGGYVVINNTGAADDRLIGGTSPAAGRLEVHEMAMEGDVMKMRKLDDGTVVPAGKVTELKPGGLHLMFFEIPEPFKEGATVPVTLEFAKAGKVDLVFPVLSPKGKGDEHKQGHNH